jgi:hypothetical protein
MARSKKITYFKTKYDRFLEGLRKLMKGDPRVEQVAWPANQGFVFDETNVCDARHVWIEAGTELDRFGSKYGVFFGKKGEAFSHRSMRPLDGPINYTVYVVVERLPMIVGEIAPAFGQPGGGTQFIASRPVIDLINGGFIKEVKGVIMTQVDVEKF